MRSREDAHRRWFSIAGSRLECGLPDGFGCGAVKGSAVGAHNLDARRNPIDADDHRNYAIALDGFSRRIGRIHGLRALNHNGRHDARACGVHTVAARVGLMFMGPSLMEGANSCCAVANPVASTSMVKTNPAFCIRFSCADPVVLIVRCPHSSTRCAARAAGRRSRRRSL